MDRDQRGDEKKWDIPKLLSLKCPKWLIVFSADGSEKKITIRVNAYEKYY